MRLTVRHATSYSYAQPMRTLVQSLRLFPSRFDGQQVQDWQVTVQGFGADGTVLAQSGAGYPGQSQSSGGTPTPQVQGADPSPTATPVTGTGERRGATFRDGAGDLTETVSLRGPVSRMEILVEGTVETQDLAGMLRGHREVAPPGLYLRPTRPTDPDLALTDLARGVIAATEGETALGRAHALSEAVSGAIAYAPGETEASTTAAEAVSRGKGVCQDHAHALISLAHLASLPARYVVGYLFAEGDGDAAGSVMPEASHAWAEIWIDGLGWIGFDPANGCCPDDRYIRLCSGYDAQDAAPIRGIAFGNQSGNLEVVVAVQRQEQ